MFQILLEPRCDRQPVDHIEPDVAQYGELAEMLQRLHAPESRDRVDETDWGGREADSARPQVVEALAGTGRGDRRLDELDDR